MTSPVTPSQEGIGASEVGSAKNPVKAIRLFTAWSANGAIRLPECAYKLAATRPKMNAPTKSRCSTPNISEERSEGRSRGVLQTQPCEQQASKCKFFHRRSHDDEHDECQKNLKRAFRLVLQNIVQKAVEEVGSK